MEANGVVPDVIDVAPREKIQVRYRSGVDVNFGNELTPLSVKDEPTLDWPVEEGQLYTLIMSDPDTPSRQQPIYGEVKHWLVVNIPGTDLSKGETLAVYRGSGPPEGTGLHRYIFLIYKQSGVLKHSESALDPTDTQGRMKFKVREFVQKYNLGQPFAGNFFQAQSDDYTKAIWAKRTDFSLTKILFEANGVVPDIIDVSPLQKIQVRYPSGVEVHLGNELTPLSVKDEPTVDWSAENGQYYTLVMTDPDAPSRKEPIRGEIKHWLIVNIPGSDISKGETLAGYRGSGPGEGSGLHRYIFLVYKQPGLLSHSETPVDNESREGRVNFKVKEFAKKYNLGEPVAGNFYQAQSDEYSKQRRAMREKTAN